MARKKVEIPIGFCIRAKRTELDPTKAQAAFLEACCEARRRIWNWGLIRINTAREAYLHDLDAAAIEAGFHFPGLADRKTMEAITGLRFKRPTAFDLAKVLTRLKRDAANWAWLNGLSSLLPGEVLNDLDNAFQAWGKGNVRYPEIKKDKCKSFSVRNVMAKSGTKRHKDNPHGTLRIEQYRSTSGAFIGAVILLPIVKAIRLKERDFDVDVIRKATVRKYAGRWYVSVTYIAPEPAKGTLPPVGVDLGLHEIVARTATTETRYAMPRLLRANLAKIKRLDRWVSRKQKGSGKRAKMVQRRSNLWRKITEHRDAWLHRVTNEIAKHSTVVIEDLNVKGMARSRLALSIADACFARFRTMLEYKANVILADRFYPSSQICPCCRNKQKMPLNKRTYICECGLTADRDSVAAHNLLCLAAVLAEVSPPEWSQSAVAKSDGGDTLKGERALSSVCVQPTTFAEGPSCV